jgi:hypothetical protein
VGARLNTVATGLEASPILALRPIATLLRGIVGVARSPSQSKHAIARNISDTKIRIETASYARFFMFFIKILEPILLSEKDAETSCIGLLNLYT